MKENKFAVGIGSWMIGNMIGQSLTSTGAFEIVYKGKVIFSKLEQRRMPSVEDVMSPFKKLHLGSSPSSTLYSSSHSRPSPHKHHEESSHEKEEVEEEEEL